MFCCWKHSTFHSEIECNLGKIEDMLGVNTAIEVFNMSRQDFCSSSKTLRQFKVLNRKVFSNQHWNIQSVCSWKNNVYFLSGIMTRPQECSFISFVFTLRFLPRAPAKNSETLCVPLASAAGQNQFYICCIWGNCSKIGGKGLVAGDQRGAPTSTGVSVRIPTRLQCCLFQIWALSVCVINPTCW